MKINLPSASLCCMSRFYLWPLHLLESGGCPVLLSNVGNAGGSFLLERRLPAGPGTATMSVSRRNHSCDGPSLSRGSWLCTGSAYPTWKSALEVLGGGSWLASGMQWGMSILWTLLGSSVCRWLERELCVPLPPRALSCPMAPCARWSLSSPSPTLMRSGR